MIRQLIAVATLGLGLSAAHAQSPPSVPPPRSGATIVFPGNAALSAALPYGKALPLPSCDGSSWSNMVDGMRSGLVRIGATDWYQNSRARGLKSFVYNHEGAPTKFAAFILREGVTKFSDMPYAQGESWSGFADTEFTDTMLSYSTENVGMLATTSELVRAPPRSKFAGEHPMPE